MSTTQARAVHRIGVHLTSSDLISADCIWSDLNSCKATQFSVAATNHRALGKIK